MHDLRANFLWTLAGNIGYAACQWCMLVLLAKMGDAEMVGQFALALAILTPVLMFSNLQLRSIQATDARHEFSVRDYLALRIVTTLLALIIIATLAWLLADFALTSAVVIIVGLARGAESVSDVYHGLFQRHERMDRISMSLLIKGVISVVALAVVLWFTQSILWGSVALAAVALATLALYDYPAARAVVSANVSDDEQNSLPESVLPRWHLHRLWGLAWLAMPLGLVMFLVSLGSNLPRYFIEHYQGLAALGVFAAVSYLIVAGNRVVSALGESASPRLARHYAAGELAAFGGLLLRLLLLGVALSVLTMAACLLAGRELLTILYNAEYADHVELLWWIAGVGSLGYLGSFLGYAMTAARYFFIQTPLFTAAGIATAAACALLVPDYGTIGAAWAMGIGMIVQVIGSAGVIVYAITAAPGRQA